MWEKEEDKKKKRGKRGKKENSLIFIKQFSCIGRGICVLNSL